MAPDRLQTWRTFIIFCVALTVGCPHGKSSKVDHSNVAFDVAPNGKHIVFSSATGDLFLLTLADQNLRQITKTAGEESNAAFSPDGKTLVYTANAGGKGKSIFQCSVDGTEVRQLTTDPDVCDSLPRYSPDGTQIVFARAHRYRPYSMGGWTWDDWDVYVMDTNGGNLRRVTDWNHYSINRVLFSSDGKTIFYSGERGQGRGPPELVTTVFSVASNGDEPPTLVTPCSNAPDTHGACASEPALTPDGDRLVFISDRGTPYHYDIFLMERINGDLRALNVTRSSRYNRYPAFSPDGKQILFLAGTESNDHSRPIFSLWSVDTDGQNAQQLAPSEMFTDPLKWTRTR